MPKYLLKKSFSSSTLHETIASFTNSFKLLIETSPQGYFSSKEKMNKLIYGFLQNCFFSGASIPKSLILSLPIFIVSASIINGNPLKKVSAFAKAKNK